MNLSSRAATAASPSRPASFLFPTGWVVMLIAITACTDLGSSEARCAEPTQTGIKLVIDYGDGVEKHFRRLTWKEGETAWSLLQQAAAHARGVQLKHQGRGDTLLVLAIDDVANEGGSGRNWIYRVNDELGDRSAGIRQLINGDTVLWRFERYQ